jgi:hypothetical protein
MNRLERWSVVIGSFLVTVTGVAYGWMKYLLRSDDPFAVINHPWQPAVLKLHILAAPVLVFGLGLIAVRHVVAHWLAGVSHARRSGVTAAVTVLPMVLSGYLIQAAAEATWLTIAVWTHIVTGLVYGAAFAGHQLLALSVYHPSSPSGVTIMKFEFSASRAILVLSVQLSKWPVSP